LEGGSFEIACAKELGLKVKGFDIFDLLVNYWQAQISNPKKLGQALAHFQPNKDVFKSVKEELKLHWDGTKKIKNIIKLAAYYYFNHNTSY
jgi:site-specific DNA-adenine methylase